MGAVVLHRGASLEYFCPKQGQDFKPLAAPLAAPLYPNMGTPCNSIGAKALYCLFKGAITHSYVNFLRM